MSYLRQPLIALCLFASAGLSCSLIVPDESDDGVVRCKNSDECPSPTSPLSEAVCGSGDGQDPNSPGVCWEVLRLANCAPEKVGDETYREAFDAAQASSGAYGGCTDAEGNELKPEECEAGNDVRDQYCRSFYCREEMACSRVTGSAYRCTACEDDKEIAEGGCASIYLGGEISPMYTDLDDCKEAVATFGTAPVVGG
ncbi:MAG: hypothetical protein V3V08_23750 [Nannocystaceae bacterium]